MNTNDLYLEYARVIQMCKGTELENKPVHCVRWKWKGTDKWFYSQDDGHPNLNDFMLNQDVDFAVAVLEGKPVFVGDVLYSKLSRDKEPDEFIVRGITDDDGLLLDDTESVWYVWRQHATYEKPTPKRTFTLNSVELPCPEPEAKYGENYTFDISGDYFGFKTKHECDVVYDAIMNLLTEARDK